MSDVTATSSCEVLPLEQRSSRLTLQNWERTRNFLFDLTDPEMYGFAVTDEVRRRALELLELFK